MPKFKGGRGQQFLKVLKFNLWVVIPWLKAIPHRWWLIAENTILVEDNPTKSIVNPLALSSSLTHELAIEKTPS